MNGNKNTKRKIAFSFGRSLTTAFLVFLLLGVLPLGAQKYQCVDFEDLHGGQTFVLGNLFVDSGTRIKVERTICTNGSPCSAPGKAMVYSGTSKAGGTGNEIFLDPFNLRFEFGRPINGLTLRFSERGIGNINIEVNGDFRNEPHLTDINGSTIGGVQVTVIGGERNQPGILELNGRIESFVIGGFELYIDDVCPMMEGNTLYFSEYNPTPGAVYRFRPDTGSTMVIYRRPAGQLHCFAFAPDDPNRLYYVNYSQNKIFAVLLDSPTHTEQVVYTHTKPIQDVAFDSHGNLYFSEAYRDKANGMIWRLEPNGTAAPFYQVLLSEVHNFWNGNFDFAPDDELFLSSGHVRLARLYRVDTTANTVDEIFYTTGFNIVGFSHGPEGHIYCATMNPQIRALEPAAGMADHVVFEERGRRIWDVEFRKKPTGINVPGTWVMPYAVRAVRFNRIKPTGLIDYTDASGKIEMQNAPFAGVLHFRLHSSNNIPTNNAYYYRYAYRPKGTKDWTDFDNTISVHYEKPGPGGLPVFPKFALGPHNIGGKKLYRFRPHEPQLKALVGNNSAVWPKIPFPGDVYRAYINTAAEGLAPGKYEIRIEIYNSAGAITAPGSFFKMIAATGTDSNGTIIPAPAALVGKGVQYTLHIDNRSCSAAIDPPKIGVIETDNCGFLRYNKAAPGQVRIGWHAWHPGKFGVFRFNIIRGASGIGTLPLPPVSGNPTPSVVLPLFGEVFTTEFHGNGAGKFFVDSPTLRLLGTCEEAAYASILRVYAKATNGNGHRITGYDAGAVRAFAIALEREK